MVVHPIEMLYRRPDDKLDTRAHHHWAATENPADGKCCVVEAAYRDYVPLGVVWLRWLLNVEQQLRPLRHDKDTWHYIVADVVVESPNLLK